VKISPEIIGLIDEIGNDRTHGASQLARQSLEVLRTAAEHSQADSARSFVTEQNEIGLRLISTRPAMAPIYNMVSRMLSTITGTAMDLDTIRQLTISRADELISGSLEALALITGHGSELIADNESIMTHSYSSTVVAVLKEASTRHKGIEVTVTRSGPGRSGEKTAQELAIHGIPITFIDDTAVGVCLPTVNRVMVGADRVCADGGVVNGAGTYQLALASKVANTPICVLCETLKFDPRLRSNEIDLEEKEPSEVAEPGRLPPGVRIRNPYFDITPLELINAVVTENGLLSTTEVISYLRR